LKNDMLDEENKDATDACLACTPDAFAQESQLLICISSFCTRSDKLERYEAWITAAKWDIDSWTNRTRHTADRSEYLRVDLTLGGCKEDKGLPAELVSKYF
jgi:hypothetical protein